MPTAVITGAGSGLGRAIAIGKLTERPRPILIMPRWRSLQLRMLDLFPRLTVRLLPLAMSDARRRQRRYAKRIASGSWS